MSRYSETELEYYYWGTYGPAITKRRLLSGALTVFIVLPLLALAVVSLIVVLLVAIAVPPIGVAMLTAGNS